MNILITFFCASFFYISILAGYAGLFCPLLPILLISNRLYRFLADMIFSFWQFYPPALVEVVCKIRVEVYGDPVIAGENSVLSMNHRTRTESIFSWTAFYHVTKGPLKYNYPIRFFLKDNFRHIPGLGWVMQQMCYLYLKREWNCDEKIVKTIVKYLCDLSHKSCLFIFPEGAVQTPSRMKRSHKYAEKHNLPKFDYLLHVKTTGFSYLVQYLMSKKSLDAVYDITIAYPDLIPQSELMLLAGNLPKKVIFHFKRIPASELPQTEQGLRHFLEKKWLEKEEVLKIFYTNGKCLTGELQRENDCRILYVALIFWTLLPFVVLYSICFYTCFRYIVLIHTLFLFYINYMGGYGFEEFEIRMFNIKKKIFGKGF